MRISGILSIESLHLTQNLFLACLNPTMSRIQGDNLRVFPSMSQYGWCFVEDQKDDTRRGWVPGVSCHFHLYCTSILNDFSQETNVCSTRWLAAHCQVVPHKFAPARIPSLSYTNTH
jgi:hypothetical protein